MESSDINHHIDPQLSVDVRDRSLAEQCEFLASDRPVSGTVPIRNSFGPDLPDDSQPLDLCGPPCTAERTPSNNRITDSSCVCGPDCTGGGLCNCRMDEEGPELVDGDSPESNTTGFDKDRKLGRIDDSLADPEYGMKMTQELLQELEELRRDVSRMRAAESARQGAEEALAHSEIFGQALLRSLPAHVAVLDRTGKILGTNTSWERLACDTKGNTLIIGSTGTNYYELCAELTGSMANYAISARNGLNEISEGLRADFDLIYPAKYATSARRWWLFRAVPIAHANGGIVVTHLDVTRQRDIEESLSENLTSFKLLFDHHPHPMWVYDIDTLRFLEVNDAAISRYGYSRAEFVEMTIMEIRPQEERMQLYQYLTSGGVELLFEGEKKHVLKDQSEIDVDVVSHLLEFHGRRAVMVMSENITERKLLHERLLSSQKMDIVGRLASGIAYDLNNSLTEIMGFSGLAELDIPFDHPASKQLHGIQTSASEAASLLQQLLSFARRQNIELKSVDLNGLLMDVDHLLRHIVGDQIEIITLPKPNLGMVRADPIQLGQAIVNLADYARRAMPRGGKLTLKTDNRSLKKRLIRDGVGVEPGEYVNLSISDTSNGLSEEVRQRIFEPFFSSIEALEDSGLGMATVYGIVKQSGGYVWVASELGKGTQFEILFPRSNSVDPDNQAPAAGQPRRGTETILVADDEPMVRSIAIQALRVLGYTVLEAANGREALRMARDHGGKIDLLVADESLPLVKGNDLHHKLIANSPGMKLLLISDVEFGQTNLASHQLNFTGRISKPFTVPGLAESVRTLLDD